jgi:hypothetical protein
VSAALKENVSFTTSAASLLQNVARALSPMDFHTVLFFFKHLHMLKRGEENSYS